MSPAARRCVAALSDGRPAPPGRARALDRPRAAHVRARARPRPGAAAGASPTLSGARAAAGPDAAAGASTRELAGDPRRPVLRARARPLPRRRARSGSTRARSRCCRRSASSTPAPPGWWRCRPPTDAPLEVGGLGGELKPFQRAGVSYLLARRRAFLADEQGLGKTIEALAALEADGAYPAVVVCPASLKLNWLRELERWLPARSAQALSGHGARDRRGARTSRSSTTTSWPRGWTSCSAVAPRALVLDESHYCKNASAKRTQAVQRLAATVPRRRTRARADGHARDEPSRRARLAAAHPRPAGGLRLGSGVRRALPRRRRAPAPALAPARAVLRAPPEGRRAAAAPRQDARGRAGGARQRGRVPARRARRGGVAA